MKYAILAIAMTLIADSAAAQSISVCSKADETRWEAVTVREGGPSVFYPPQAREEGREGTANVRFTINKDGKVSALMISSTSGYRDLDAEALRAIGTKIYPPMLCGGLAREYTTSQSIRFLLNHEPATPTPPLGEARRAMIESIVKKLPPELPPAASSAAFADNLSRRLQMEYPAIPAAALRQVVEAVQGQFETARQDTSALNDSLVSYFNNRYSESELRLLEQLVNQPGGETLLKKLSTLFLDHRAVTLRWNDAVVERSLAEALARQKQQSPDAAWLAQLK